MPSDAQAGWHRGQSAKASVLHCCCTAEPVLRDVIDLLFFFSFNRMVGCFFPYFFHFLIFFVFLCFDEFCNVFDFIVRVFCDVFDFF